MDKAPGTHQVPKNWDRPNAKLPDELRPLFGAAGLLTDALDDETIRSTRKRHGFCSPPKQPKKGHPMVPTHRLPTLPFIHGELSAS